jgi:hypothetical protein
MLAAVAMMLIDDGRLTLRESVDKLLPELAGRRVLARIDGPLDETMPAERPIHGRRPTDFADGSPNSRRANVQPAVPDRPGGR